MESAKSTQNQPKGQLAWHRCDQIPYNIARVTIYQLEQVFLMSVSLIVDWF